MAVPVEVTDALSTMATGALVVAGAVLLASTALAGLRIIAMAIAGRMVMGGLRRTFGRRE